VVGVVLGVVAAVALIVAAARRAEGGWLSRE
jgi:hypothetical protein